MTTWHRIVPSPIGPLTLVVREGALLAMWMDAQRHLPDAAAFGTAESRLTGTADTAVLERAQAQLGQYFAGERREFELELAPVGTEFQRAVWLRLREIEYGSTTTYGRIARSLGQPTASRAVGAAVGRNPIGLIVPCHRVVGESGALTGYAGGIERKTWLLRHEGVLEPALL